MNLVKLYAERHEMEGHGFAPDGPWQTALEESFPYDPTPDQLKAIADMKRDQDPAALISLAADWNDRYGALPTPVETLLLLMRLKLVARRCGFTRIKPERPNLVLETPMQEPAFRRLRQGLPQHLHGRLVYQGGNGGTARVVARGLGAFAPEQQATALMEWLEAMASQT